MFTFNNGILLRGFNARGLVDDAKFRVVGRAIKLLTII
jgi:hypothetical protein